MNIHTQIELEMRDQYISEIRLQLNEKSEYIVKLEKENSKLRKVVDAIKAMKAEQMKEQIWYLGIGCEFAEAVDESLEELEQGE
jgi:regulator of replication initiation timing